MNDGPDNSPGSMLTPRRASGAALDPNGRSTTLRPSPYPEIATYGPSPEDEDLRAKLFYYVRLFIKRRWLILAIALASVAIGMARAFMQTPLYTASVRIQIDRQAAKVVDNGAVAPTEAGGLGGADR